MAQPETAPFGSWQSPITSDLITSSTIRLGDIAVSGETIYWLESRPLEGGRYVVVRRDPDGTNSDVTPAEFNARTRVHEYGGGSYWVHGATVFFTNFTDQRLYRQDAGQEPRPITPEPPSPAAVRYADGSLTPDGRLIICVRERHLDDGEVINELVSLPADGSAEPVIIAEGRDFYSYPRISPDGDRLTWTQWDHPNMPWDGVELWLATLNSDGTLVDEHEVAGGTSESIFQPSWSPDGTLHFVSDRTGWWNLYALRDDGAVPLAPLDAEFGLPQWSFAQSTYDFLSDGSIACIYGQKGIDHLALVRPGSGSVEPVESVNERYMSLGSLHALPGTRRVCFSAASASEPTAIVTLDLANGDLDILKQASNLTVDTGYLSTPEPIEFPTEDGKTAHALFYPPKNRDFTGGRGERPPLLVFSHGGPTGHTVAALNLSIQFWTSRGFAVVDVNYGGSTGYGREYRERLKGNWGIVDIADCVNAARYLVERGDADGERLAIRGGSAGGYTTLAALAFTDAFKAGASYYGVADAGALARDTHKFESRYLDGLIGPYPEAEDLYEERSALFHADQISCPLILFQGLEDKVVPPAQAEAMVSALQENRIPYAYVPFEGEQHGFRKAENQKRAMDAELYFYSRIFGFEPADEIEPVKIENL